MTWHVAVLLKILLRRPLFVAALNRTSNKHQSVTYSSPDFTIWKFSHFFYLDINQTTLIIRDAVKKVLADFFR